MNNDLRANELSERFEEGWRTFYQVEASFSAFYRGPCLHFHLRTVSVLGQILSGRNLSYRAVCESEEFVELLYATLTAWGMNRMGGGPKMQDYPKFREAIRGHAFFDALNVLKDSRLVDIDDIENIRESVKNLFDYLASDHRITKSDKALVGVSKTLHHLLPDLLLPVDREYTTSLLSHLHEDRFRPTKQGDSFRDYWNCVRFSHFVARDRHLRSIEPSSDYPMNTSVPKLIDNAIVGLKFLLLPE